MRQPTHWGRMQLSWSYHRFAFCDQTHNSFRKRATGIFSCSLYFATVRRAILYPFSCSNSVNFSSLNGFFLLSPSIKSLSIFFTSLVETSSPLSVLKDSLKKNLSRYVPNSVCTNLLLATRLTVDISSPVLSAISFNIIGLSDVSSPERKNSSLYSIMVSITLVKVCWRCLITSMIHLAASIFCLINNTASFCLLSFLLPLS